jgi:adenylate kinase family enzyme
MGTQPLTRAHFTGASGSGTTTLGQALARRAKLRHFETDDYLWEPTDPPFHQLRAKDERVRLLEADLGATSGWVLSGSLARWGDPLVPRFQLVVFVVAPTELRLARLRERELRRFGAEALAPAGAMHANHLEFMQWAARYDDGDESIRSRRLHETWRARLTCQSVEVDGSRPIDLLVDELLPLLDCQ